MRNWYLIYTKPRNEDHLAGRFLDMGLEVLNPRIREKRHIRRKVREVESPLFPCYMFLKFDDTRDYRLVKYARGVRSVVGSGERPAVVPENIIESIRERMVEGVVTIKPGSFAPGDDVMIRGGGLEGFEAVFEREINGIERVSILLKSAIRARVVIDGALLTKV